MRWLLALMFVLVGVDAHATSTRPFSLSELVHAAHAIVRGEVIDQESVWDPQWHEVYTLSWVRVDEVLDGRDRVGDLVVVKQIGGTLDGRTRSVVGVATLGLGDEVVLFARTDGTFHYLVGMAQGAFHRVGQNVVRGALPTLGPSVAPMRPLAPDDVRWSTFRADVMALVHEVRP